MVGGAEEYEYQNGNVKLRFKKKPNEKNLMKSARERCNETLH